MRRENICVINRDLIKIEHRASDKYVYEWLEDYLKGKSTFLNLFLQTAIDANTFFHHRVPTYSYADYLLQLWLHNIHVTMSMILPKSNKFLKINFQP